MAHQGGLKPLRCRCPKTPLTTTSNRRRQSVLLDANGQPTDWEVVRTAGKCRQKTYYWNSQTGAVSWEVPRGCNISGRARSSPSVELTPQGMEDTNDIRLATSTSKAVPVQARCGSTGGRSSWRAPWRRL